MIATDWLALLGVLVGGQRSSAESEQLILLYAEMLRGDRAVEDRLTMESLRYVAKRVRGWPVYSILRELLDEHAANVSAARRSNAAPDVKLPSAADAWDARQAELRKEWSDKDTVLSALVGLEAHRDTPVYMPLLRLLRGAVEVHAPELLHLLPVSAADANPWAMSHAR